jgi:hypothetical protein
MKKSKAIEQELLAKYHKGVFKMRSYAHKDYPFVVGIPKRYMVDRTRGRRFFKTAVEAADFIEKQLEAIRAGRLKPSYVRGYLPAAELPQNGCLPVNNRITLLHQTTSMVVSGVISSAIVSGPGGLGKTHEVDNALSSCGLNQQKGYTIIKGYSSARGLYEALYMNNDTLLVLDDCDAALTDRTAIEILKGALDTYSTRTISWLVKSKNADPSIPNSFEFTGRLIFITNRCLVELDQALRTRCLVIDLTMTKDEIFTRMQEMARNLTGYTENEKSQALQFVNGKLGEIKNLSLRTLLMVLKILKSNPTNWETLATYTVTQG